MATLQNTDLLLLNRGNVTYKGTAAQVSDLVIENILDATNPSNLVLNALGDVNTNGNGPNPDDQGKFLLAGGDGVYMPLDFRSAVDIEIIRYLSQNPITGGGAARIFSEGPQTGLLDVNQVTPAFEDRYKKTFLLGQNYALGNGQEEFQAVDFDQSVLDVVLPIVDAEVPKVLNDLNDVDYSSGIQPGDILIYSTTNARFVEAPLRDSVIEIINQNGGNINIGGGSLPKANYYDETSGIETAYTAMGIAAVKKHDGTDLDPQVLQIEQFATSNGTVSVLDVNIPNIPDVFQYIGPVYFNRAGDAFKDEGGTTPYAAPSTALKGDIFAALPTSNTATGDDPVDPTSKRELLGWESASLDDGTGVDVSKGSLIVCTLAGNETSNGGRQGPQFAVMGELDYDPAEPDLQSVLDADNRAVGKNIELTNGNVVLVSGSFTTTIGNITTGLGQIKTTRGDIITDDGDLIIGVKGETNEPNPTDPDFNSNVLSVPGIDFARFPDIDAAP